MLPRFGLILLLFILSLFFICIPAIAEKNYDSLNDLTWVTEEYPPFTFIDNSTASGLMVDMVIAITRKAGEELPRESVRFLPWSDAYQKALKEPGTVIFSIAMSPERKDLFSWVGPVVSSDIDLYSLRNRNISVNNTSDLSNYTIGTVTDDVTIDYLADAGVDKNSIVTDPDPYTLIKYLDNGTIDLFAYGNIAAEYHIKNATGKSGFYKVSGQLGSFPVYIGFSKGTPALLVEKFRKAFEEIKKTPDDGGMSEFDQILSSWILGNGLSHMKYLTEGYYPYTFKKDGVPKGISVDILKYIFSRYNINVPDDHFIFGTWEDVYNRTQTQNGTAISVIARSPERENLFRWAGPIARTPIVIFSLRDSADKFRNMSPSDMKIGTITDDIAATALINAGGKDIVYSSDPKELIKKLEDGTIDGFAYASLPGRQLINQYASDPASIVPGQTLKNYDFYIAFNPNTSVRLVQSFQDTMDLIRTEKDGSGVSMYDRILYRYIEPDYSDSTITAEEVINLVNQTAADLAADASGTIQKINEGLVPYRSLEKPDLYVFVYDTDLNMVAHADNIRMVGENYHNKTDAAGKPFRDEIVAGALANGTGWEDYIYSNPVESGLFWKTTWYQLTEGSDGKKYVVCSGMFRNKPE